MHLIVLVLFTATALFDDVSGYVFPPTISHLRTKSMDFPRYKRQEDTVQCVNNKLDTAFSGENSNFGFNCKRSARELDDYIDTSDYSQATITSIFSTFCDPDCGNVIIDAFNDCGHFEQGVSNLRDFIIGLCGTNQNGDICYQIYSASIYQLTSERSCYNRYNYNTYGYNYCAPSCRNTLSEGVQERGCCLNAFHNFVSSAGWDYSYAKADELYDACNIDLPTGCNNSPITGSGRGVMFQVPLVTVMSVLIFSFFLG